VHSWANTVFCKGTDGVLGMWWRELWDGLNIRKFIVVAILFIFVVSSLSKYSFLNDQDTKELILICMSYYFGYSNRGIEEKK
jgi:hypothetical protein